jgi:ribulose-bisphosphate carboxylase large chain
MHEQDEFLAAVYEIEGPERDARGRAERICLDQTIEADADLLPPPLRGSILGCLQRLEARSGGRYHATIHYPASLLAADCSAVLNVLFGTSSLRGDVRLLSFTLTQGLLSAWPGPRYGLAGIRRAVGVTDRPLVCAVLKPVGRSPTDLAELAGHFVRAGVDLVKDDQGLLDQPFCPFAERVARCAEAISKASAQRGRPCIYFAHISGALDTMRQRAVEGKRCGATGLLVAPGLTGFDALRTLAMDQTLALPIASHPSLSGMWAAAGAGGLAPRVAYALLPRLAGADLSVFPAFDSGYRISKDDCIDVAAGCRQPWHHLVPVMPAVGGRMAIDRIAELRAALGQDVIFVLGSRIQQDRRGVAAAIEDFQRELTRPSKTSI